MVEVILWVLVLVGVLLVVTHPKGFSQSATTLGTEGNTIIGTLSGKGVGG